MPSADQETTTASLATANAVRTGRPSAKDEVHTALDALAAQEHRVHDMDLSKVAELVATHCGKRLDKSPGWATRTVTGHISEWRKLKRPKPD